MKLGEQSEYIGKYPMEEFKQEFEYHDYTFTIIIFTPVNEYEQAFSPTKQRLCMQFMYDRTLDNIC